MTDYDFKPPREMTDLQIQFQKTLETFTRQRYAMVERHLIGAIEQLEGRVPTNAEVIEHGKRNIYPDGTEEWCWKGKPFMRIPADALKNRDGKFVFEFESVFKE